MELLEGARIERGERETETQGVGMERRRKERVRRRAEGVRLAKERGKVSVYMCVCGERCSMQTKEKDEEWRAGGWGGEGEKWWRKAERDRERERSGNRACTGAFDRPMN